MNEKREIIAVQIAMQLDIQSKHECKHCKFATHCAHITKVNGKYYPLCQVDN